MTLNYFISAEDQLQHQLFNASKSPITIKQRRKNWLISTLYLFILTALLIWHEKSNIGYYFLCISILFFGLYPRYLTFHYKKHYTKLIKQTFEGKPLAEVTLTINEAEILTSDETGESKIDIAQIIEIVEIESYIFLIMRFDGSLIIPKYKLENSMSIVKTLQEIANQLKIEYKLEMDWKWK